MNNKTVLLCCPMRDRAWILPYYLDHIYKLDYPKHLIGILWVINQSTDDSEKILREFKNKYEHEYNSITIEKHSGSKIVPKDARTSEIRLHHIYTHLSEIRNYILSKVGNHDYIFSCDSDILVRQDCLSKLVNHDKDVVSATIFNGYRITEKENVWRYPNALRKLTDGTIEHVANSYIKKSPEATESKLLKVSITGAIYLISKKVAQNVEYSYHVQGEDIPFCLDAEGQGFEIWIDAGIFNHHIMDEGMLEDYLAKLDNRTDVKYTKVVTSC